MKVLVKPEDAATKANSKDPLVAELPQLNRHDRRVFRARARATAKGILRNAKRRKKEYEALPIH